MGKVKMTKSQIIEGLKKITGFIEANAEIQAEIDFVVDEFAENNRNVTMEELKPLVESVEKFTNKGFVQLIAEAEGQVQQELTPEVKPEGKKPKVLPKKSTDKAETSKKIINTKKQEPNNPEEKEVNKGEEIKEVTKEEVKEEVKEQKPTTKKTLAKKEKKEEETVELLPQLINSKSLKADLVARPDLKTIQDIAKAFAEGTDFVIATYWTRRHLKQFASSYDPMNINPNRPTAFENDLDLIEVTYANDLVVTGVSLYSFVPQIFLPINFDRDEEYGLRFANGVEFEVYEVVENIEE